MRVELTVRAPLIAHEVAISAPDDTPWRLVLERLQVLVPEAGSGLWAGPRPLDPNASLATVGVAPGQLLTAGGPGDGDLAAGAPVRLHVVGGPSAGRVVALRVGETAIGRSPTADLALDDPRLSRRHAAISVSATGLRVRDLDSTNGTKVDGRAVTAAGCPLPQGAYVRIGDSLLTVVASDAPLAAARSGPNGTRLVNRVPRPSPLVRDGADPVTIAPVTTTHSLRPRGQLLATLAPALAGVGFALVAHQLAFLAFALIGPLVLAGSTVLERRHQRRTGRSSRQRHRRQQFARDLEGALQDERRRRRDAHPDPAAILQCALGPTKRLWERRRGDPDFLDVRVGLADQPTQVLLGSDDLGEAPRPAGMIANAPVTLSLQTSPVGVCGPHPSALALSRWILGQLVVLHSPADLTVVVLAPAQRHHEWSWTHRLPHVRRPAAATAAEQALRVAELVEELDRRRASTASHGLSQPSLIHGGVSRPTSGWAGPWIVVVIDADGETATPDGLAELAALLEFGAAYGITALTLARQPALLPAGGAVVSFGDDVGAILHVGPPETPLRPDCLADQVDDSWADSISRALAPLRDPAEPRSTSLPATCGLFESNGLSTVDRESLTARWHQGGSTSVGLGIGPHGPLMIDLVQDGPHALIAGTTGAGKSELLRSLIAGLAIGNSPRDLSFILIDYKGGAAFAECARLPHVVGVVTDLNERLVLRALRSLTTELRRREGVLAVSGVRDFDAYRRSPAATSHPLGRLLLVVDEFATLADELPDLLGGLLAIARRGRSLGVHLILATQRPSGVVSPEIQANLALRIALRVTDSAESMAVIGSAAAAAIDRSRPGRAVARLGTRIEEFQTAQVGRPMSAGTEAITVSLLSAAAADADDEHDTQHATHCELDQLIDAAVSAARRPDFERAPSPWLPPLSEMIAAEQLPPTDDRRCVAIGRHDQPHEQAQPLLTVNLATGGSLLIAGPARSGRTAALRTLAAVAAGQLTPDEFQFYVLDCADGGLSSLTALQHCGAALTRADPGAIGRLLSRLGEEVSRRRADGSPQPALLLLIDGWEAFVDTCDGYEPGVLIDQVHRLLRDARSAGLTIAITASPSNQTNRLTSALGRVFVLAEGGTSPAPGRAIATASGDEVQFAYSDPGSAGFTTGPDRCAGVSGGGPIRVRALPGAVRLAEVDQSAATEPGDVVLGVGGDAGEVVPVNLFRGDGRWLIAGPPRSGRTTLLVSLLTQLDAAGVATLVAAGARSALTETARRLGIATLTPDGQPRSSTPPRGPGPGSGLIVLVDDCDLFTSDSVADWLREVAVGAGDGRSAIVVSGRCDELAVSYRGVAALVRRSQTGVLLAPGPADGELLGVRLPRVRSTITPGRGVLVCDQPQVARLLHGQPALPIQIAN